MLPSRLRWRERARRSGLLGLGLAVIIWAAVWASPAAAGLPPGFAEQATHSGMIQPTAFEFAPDGRLFVGEKRGVIKTFDDVGDTTPRVFADLRTEVHNYSDRGLLGLTVDPAWPTRPYVYVYYVYDAPPGGVAPTYGSAESDSDSCPSQSYFTDCPATVRVSRLTAGIDGVMTDSTVLLSEVCQDVPLLEGGGMAVGPEGALYLSIGTGAYAGVADYGQFGNACGDPPGAAGTSLSPPSAEGGHLRAQDLRTPADPASVTGSVIRIDPDSGAPWPTNPLISSPDPEARKVVAQGLRNPFRITLLPGTSDVWLGDVGADRAEEINRVDPDGPVENFGWPCFEGATRNTSFDTLDLDICENLYAEGSHVDPYYFYCHGPAPPPGTTCSSTTSGAITGLAFYTGGSYPARYTGALFFADYTKGALRVMLPGTDGIPDPSTVETFATGLGGPVDLRSGPGGDLFYLDVFDGTLRRIYVGLAGDPPPPPTVHPTATIDSPASDDLWAVGDNIPFSGHAVDADGAPLPATSLSWALNMLHCYSDNDCHRHRVRDFPNVAEGSITAPNHDYPAKIELVLTATDHLGNTDVTSVTLQPRIVELTFQTDPAGLLLTAGDTVAPGPFSKHFIVGSVVFVNAPRTQNSESGPQEFRSWSDGGAAAHIFTAGSSPATYTATYAPASK